MRKASFVPLVIFSIIILGSMAHAALTLNLPSELPDAKAGEKYAYVFSVAGGVGPYTMYILDQKDFTRNGSGLLWMDLDGENRELTGTPEINRDEGFYQFELCVADEGSETYATICKKSTLYVLSDVVTVKGTGSVSSILVWEPPTYKGQEKSLSTTLSSECRRYDPRHPGLDYYATIEYFSANNSVGAYTEAESNYYINKKMYLDTPNFTFNSNALNLELSSSPQSGCIRSSSASAKSSAMIENINDRAKVSFTIASQATRQDKPLATSAYSASLGSPVILIITNTGTTSRLVDITMSGKVYRSADATDAYLQSSDTSIKGTIPTTGQGLELEDYDQLIAQNRYNDTSFDLNLEVTGYYWVGGDMTSNKGVTNTSTATKRFILYPGKHTYRFTLEGYTHIEKGIDTTGDPDAFSINELIGGELEFKVSPVACEDTLPPMTSAIAVDGIGVDYIFGEQTLQAPVKISLDCTDTAKVGCDFSGCSSTYYCTDTMNTCNPDTFAPLSIEVGMLGTSYIRYYSVDKVGNKEEVQSKPIVLGGAGYNIQNGQVGQVASQPKPASTPPSKIIQNGSLVAPASRSDLTAVSQRKYSTSLVKLFGISEWKSRTISTCIRGSICVDSEDCCGGGCDKGFCLCGVNACSASGECCTGYCDEGQCRTPPTTSSFLFSKPLQGCAGMIDECLPGEGGCIAICGALTFLLLASVFSAGAFTWRRFNHPVPGVAAAAISLLVGLMFYSFVGIITAFAIIAMLSYIRKDIKVIPVPSGLSELLQTASSSATEAQPTKSLQTPQPATSAKSQTGRTAKTSKK